MLSTLEDDHHDFKREWYHKGQKLEMIKDIFSFVNTVHEDDCYLIIGVTDDLEIVGVESKESTEDIANEEKKENEENHEDKDNEENKESTENEADKETKEHEESTENISKQDSAKNSKVREKNRLNQQKLIDYLRELPIAGQFIPEIEVETVNLAGHEIDIIKIINTTNVPCFLTVEWKEKKTKDYIRPGQIFYREKDVNTPKIGTATYNQVQKLWQKHFRMNLPIQERYKYTLQDRKNWSYVENDGEFLFYNLNPDFYIEIANDDFEKRSSIEAYSIDQTRTKISWDILKINYRQITIFEYCAVWLDGGRQIVKTPRLGSIKVDGGLDIYYYCFVKSSIEYQIQKLFEHGLPSLTDNDIIRNFYNDVVLYSTDDEKDEVEKYLQGYSDLIEEIIEPTDNEVTNLDISMESDFAKGDSERSNTSKRAIIREKKLGQFLSRFVTEYQFKKDFSKIDVSNL